MSISPLERAARALCRLDGHPENATMDGKPLWQDYLPEVRAVLEAIREPDDRGVTEGMCVALNAGEGAKPETVEAIYRAMIDAALK